MRTELPKSYKNVVSKTLLLFGHMDLDSRGVPRLVMCSGETGSLPKLEVARTDSPGEYTTHACLL